MPSADDINVMYEAIPAPFDDWAFVVTLGDTDHVYVVFGEWFAMVMPAEFSGCTLLVLLDKNDVPDFEFGKVMITAAKTAIHTRGAVNFQAVPSKLAKARQKRRKPPLLNHYAVSDLYTTAVGNTPSGTETEHETGDDKRCSPAPHLRRGHLRRLPDGKMSCVRDTIVGVGFDPDAVQRGGYVFNS